MRKERNSPEVLIYLMQGFQTVDLSSFSFQLEITLQNREVRMLAFVSFFGKFDFLMLLVNLSRYAKFQSVASITLHFPENFGGDTTQIHYIGLKGEATQVV